MESIEQALDSVGLMAGDGADKKRIIIGALGTGFILTYLKPALMFDKGEVRPWTWLESDKEKNPTSFTLWHGMALGGIILGVFI
jgi:hypothetical protein